MIPHHDMPCGPAGARSGATSIKTFLLRAGFSVGVPLLLVLIRATPYGTSFMYVMIGIPVLFVSWGGVAIWSIFDAIRFFRAKENSKLFIASIAPTIFACVLVSPFGFLYYCQDLGDILRFVAKRASYMEEIAKLPSTNEPKLRVFNNGGMIWASAGYVYDESDEVLLPPERRSIQWKARAGNTELVCPGSTVRPFLTGYSISKHFYLASFTC